MAYRISAFSTAIHQSTLVARRQHMVAVLNGRRNRRPAIVRSFCPMNRRRDGGEPPPWNQRQDMMGNHPPPWNLVLGLREYPPKGYDGFGEAFVRTYFRWRTMVVSLWPWDDGDNTIWPLQWAARNNGDEAADGDLGWSRMETATRGCPRAQKFLSILYRVSLCWAWCESRIGPSLGLGQLCMGFTLLGPLGNTSVFRMNERMDVIAGNGRSFPVYPDHAESPNENGSAASA